MAGNITPEMAKAELARRRAAKPVEPELEVTTPAAATVPPSDPAPAPAAAITPDMARAELERRRAARGIAADDPRMAAIERGKALAAARARGEDVELPEISKLAARDPRANLPMKDTALNRFGAFTTAGVENLPIVGAPLIATVKGAASGIRTLTDGTDFSENYENADNYSTGVQEQFPGTALAGNLTGNIAITGALGATSLGGRALGLTQAGMKGKLGMSALSSGLIGGADTAVRGGGVGDVVQSAAIGGTLGAVIPAAVTAGVAAAKPAIATVAARLAPDRYANAALAAALRRSGASVDEIAARLQQAADDGQGVYTVADAMGNAGQRMLSTVVRTPNDARQEVVEQLLKRQATQGRRLQSALVEGFGAPQTKAQTEAAKTALRQSEARVNYDAARASSGTVNPTDAIAKADDFLGASGSLPLTDIAPDSVEGIVRRAKALLTDGDNIVTDFATAFRRKVELDDMIEKGTSTVKAQLSPIRNELDKALEKASPTYAKARNTYRQQSQDIEAVDVGRDAAMRGRVEDTIPRFQGLTRAEQQASFRAGYVDPYIETIQGTAGPMSNKARPLISDATADEFPVFAAPGKADQLGSRIAREQRMFETTNQALGGSRTADNLADMEDMANFDPAMISKLLRGDVTGAVIGAVTQAFNATKGLPPRVIEQVGRALMTTDATAAKRLLTIANTKALSAEGRKRAAIVVLRGLGSGSTNTNVRNREPMRLDVTEARGSD